MNPLLLAIKTIQGKVSPASHILTGWLSCLGHQAKVALFPLSSLSSLRKHFLKAGLGGILARAAGLPWTPEHRGHCCSPLGNTALPTARAGPQGPCGLQQLQGFAEAKGRGAREKTVLKGAAHRGQHPLSDHCHTRDLLHLQQMGSPLQHSKTPSQLCSPLLHPSVSTSPCNTPLARNLPLRSLLPLQELPSPDLLSCPSFLLPCDGGPLEGSGPLHTLSYPCAAPRAVH